MCIRDSRYLTHLRTTTAYFDAKDNVRSFLDGVPLVGAPLKKNITECKTLLRRAMYHSTMFEDMGFAYLGPVDGHDLAQLTTTLEWAREMKRPVLVHVRTQKGHGYAPAEREPWKFHGVGSFDAATGAVTPMPLSGSNVLRFELTDGSHIVVRPSGTEPKIKVYILTKGADAAERDANLEKYSAWVKTLA